MLRCQQFPFSLNLLHCNLLPHPPIVPHTLPQSQPPTTLSPTLSHPQPLTTLPSARPQPQLECHLHSLTYSLLHLLLSLLAVRCDEAPRDLHTHSSVTTYPCSFRLKAVCTLPPTLTETPGLTVLKGELSFPLQPLVTIEICVIHQPGPTSSISLPWIVSGFTRHSRQLVHFFIWGEHEIVLYPYGIIVFIAYVL